MLSSNTKRNAKRRVSALNITAPIRDQKTVPLFAAPEVVPIFWTLWWERSPLMVKYTREQRLRAVRLYERYDRGAASVINELGCPSRLYFVKLGCTA